MTPTSFSEITLEFLQYCLTDNGHRGELLTGFELTSLDEPGQTAAMSFIQLNYDGERGDCPDRLVAKQRTDFSDAWEYIEKMGITQREIDFYEHIGDQCQMTVPRGYYGQQAAQGDFLLLMEDKSGPHPGDWVTATLDQAKGLIGNLEAMHAHWWENQELKNASWTAGFNSEPGSFMQVMQDTYQKNAEAFVQTFNDELDDHLAETVLAAFKKPDVIRAFDPAKGTLIHGDYHYKNAFFPEESAPIVFDWQCAGHGTPTIDLARVFIFLRGGQEMDEATDLMLADYHAAIEASGVSDYSLSALTEDMALGYLYNIWLTVNALVETDVQLIRSIIESHGSTLEVLMEDFSARIRHSGAREFIEAY
jgi:thiamine kinase-like enzyme